MKGKKKRKDVAEFSARFADNISYLHQDLAEKIYRHGGYEPFKINDPKPRDIHKASVRDRLVHHAIYRVLYLYFDNKFICDSYSCRFGKGTHRAINRFRKFGLKASHNNTRSCWVLKCDIRKFFASIDHNVLKTILAKHIYDKDTLGLISEIIDSFNTVNIPYVGLPLGNLTSQLLINIYMNEFDHYIKRVLKVGFYIRYADDFVILSHNKHYLENLIPKISNYLDEKLKLTLHPDKVFIKTLASGVDFLGWVNFLKHRVLRTSTKCRMFRNLEKEFNKMTIASYLGLLKQGNANKLSNRIHLYESSQ